MATDDEWLMVKKLSDDELRSELINLNVSYLGPINSATRTANERKLIQLMQSQSHKTSPATKFLLSTKTPPATETLSISNILPPIQFTKTITSKFMPPMNPKTFSSAQTQDDDETKKEEEFQMEQVMDWEQAPGVG
ncbi:uncharacterized protein LOC142340892 isoform X1 [Convolutriloba macropyga]|uniref:uncharacterized protein LOC142340892 isoform X1 n=1 Tax=Convolutriloba macropyga TaxID=536237 RepID=UPI003F52105C